MTLHRQVGSRGRGTSGSVTPPTGPNNATPRACRQHERRAALAWRAVRPCEPPPPPRRLCTGASGWGGGAGGALGAPPALTRAGTARVVLRLCLWGCARLAGAPAAHHPEGGAPTTAAHPAPTPLGAHSPGPSETREWRRSPSPNRATALAPAPAGPATSCTSEQDDKMDDLVFWAPTGCHNGSGASSEPLSQTRDPDWGLAHNSCSSRGRGPRTSKHVEEPLTFPEQQRRGGIFFCL